DAVATLHPAIEIPDSRFADFISAGEAQIIADNACAHLFVLGEATNADWRTLDLIEERPVVAMRGQNFIGHGKNVLGDPRIALAWLANELRSLGITLRAGQVVTTGSCRFNRVTEWRWISACSGKCRWGLSSGYRRHCEERSDEAIHASASSETDCFASLAMTKTTARSANHKGLSIPGSASRSKRFSSPGCRL